MYPNMKTVAVLCFIFISATWALPKFQDPVPLKRHINPLALRHLQDVTPRIINGTEVAPHSIPYQAYLIILSQGFDAWSCGGTLISPIHVLTSAHCLYNAAEAVVLLGAHSLLDVDNSSVFATSFNFISHDGYTPEAIINDIAVVVLDEPVELNENISLATLPPRSIANDYAGKTGRISGWGHLESGGYISNVLMQANVWVISSASCRLIFNSVQDSHICSIGGEGQRFCNGDNGGPLVVNDTQIGVISFAASGCPVEYPYGYTRITSYLDWLEGATGLTF